MIPCSGEPDGPCARDHPRRQHDKRRDLRRAIDVLTTGCEIACRNDRDGPAKRITAGAVTPALHSHPLNPPSAPSTGTYECRRTAPPGPRHVRTTGARGPRPPRPPLAIKRRTMSDVVIVRGGLGARLNAADCLGSSHYLSRDPQQHCRRSTHGSDDCAKAEYFQPVCPPGAGAHARPRRADGEQDGEAQNC